MASVFAAAQTHNGGFRADQLSVVFGRGAGATVSGHLVQQIQFTYTQQVSMLYEIGSENVYYIGGRAQGTATIARVIGPRPFANDFISHYNDICRPEDITFDASAGCERGGAQYTLKKALLTTVSASVTAQEVVINEQLQFMFIDMERGDMPPGPPGA